MILDRERIRSSIEDGSIGVDPEPEPEQYQPASLDVRLGENVHLGTGPNGAKNPYTLERIEMPTDLAAMLTGRSSVGRRHVVVHQTAGWIDPGFRGNLILEMMNYSPGVQSFEKGERVAQLVFFEMTGHAEYDGQYQDQGPGGER